MSTQTGLRYLTMPPDMDGSAYEFPKDDFLPASQEPKRFKRFVPAPPIHMSPVLGWATDPAMVQALALSNGGWVSQDGRVLAKGTTYGTDALRALPETNAAVEANGKDFRETQLDKHVEEGGTVKEFNENWEPSMFDTSSGFFPKFLHEAGWLEIDLMRDEGVKVMGTRTNFVDLDKYRVPLVALAEALECRIYAGPADRKMRVLYDPADPEGLINGVEMRENWYGVPNERHPRWLSTDVPDVEEYDEYDEDGLLIGPRP